MKQSILISLVWLFAFLRQPIQATETIKVACVGNSITYGTGITNRDADSYPAQLQKLLGKKYSVGNFKSDNKVSFVNIIDLYQGIFLNFCFITKSILYNGFLNLKVATNRL